MAALVMDPPSLQATSESAAPPPKGNVGESSTGPIERTNSADPPQPQDLSGQSAEKIAPASVAKGKGKEACCPSTGRNICVSSDGTLGEFGVKNSNVVELQSRIIKDETQFSYYISGIGTYGESDVRRWWDAAVASSFERNVLEAYKWLCDTYKTGDRIFLFGFSRGAYQVRVIAGMIHLVGLLYGGNHAQIPSAFKLYMKTMQESQKTPDQTSDEKEGETKKEPDTKQKLDSEEKPDPKEEQGVKDKEKTNEDQNAKGKGQILKKKPNVKQQCQTFKKAFSRQGVKVHFVGVWDTVSSVGITRKPCFPETTNGMRHVCHFRQALALDERRVKFWPEYANTFSSPSAEGGGDVKEVWFAGSHSDIGGWSHPNENLDSFGPALRWMTYEAMNHGLHMLPHTKLWKPLVTKPTLTWKWRALEYLPLRRPSNIHGTTRRLHMGAPRHIQGTQLIHESVFEEMGIDINAIRKERAPYSSQVTLPEWLTGSPAMEHKERRLLGRLQFDAIRRITSAVASAARKIRWIMPNHSVTLAVTDQDAYKPSARFYDGNATWDDMYYLVTKRLEDDPFASVKSVMQKLAGAINSSQDTFDAAIEVFQNHVTPNRGSGRLLAISSEDQVSKALAEVSTDASSTLLSALEREVDQNSQKRARVINMLLFALATVPHKEDTPLPSNIFCTIAACLTGDESRKSYRKVVQLYDHRPLNHILLGMWTPVIYVAFSSNGEELIVTGPDLGVVNWNPKEATRKRIVPFKIHAGAYNVHISKDGSRCASGHEDGSVQLWDIGTGQRLRTLSSEGDVDPVNAVGLSSDNSKVASGSKGGVIRIWDIEEGLAMHGPMLGHTDEINIVAFSTDGSILASGADDNTICLWNTSNGRLLDVLKHHMDVVWSVAFSTCGKQILSTSRDSAVCIWDTASRKLNKELKGHTRCASCAIFSPNQKFVASGSWDESVRVWDATSGETLIVYDAGDRVLSVGFSADGKRLVSGTDNGDVHIWDTSFLL